MCVCVCVCQCANVEDHERGPIVKLNCSHSLHRDCLQEWMGAGDLTFEDACPVRCHLGLPLRHASSFSGRRLCERAIVWCAWT